MAKSEKIELLAAGIAQDFDALLTAIAGHADTLSDCLSPGDPRAAEVAAIRHAADQAATLTRQLLAFSRTETLRPSVVNLNTMVNRMRYSLQRTVGAHIELRTATVADVWPVRADAAQLEQIVGHLAMNARDAMPNGGAVTIATANLHIDEATARRRRIEPGRYVELSVRDTGIGIEPSVQAHLFEPFFTTKQRAPGHGLSLAMVHGAVRQNGGAISVESEMGRGSRFIVYLPATTDAEFGQSSGDARTRSGGGSETVLLIGGDEAVQSFIGDVLRRRGYQLLVAHDAWQAFRLANDHAAPIDLLITSGTNGAIVADALCERRPATRVLFVSASADDTPADRRRGVRVPAAILKQPFTPDALARKVRAVLGV